MHDAPHRAEETDERRGRADGGEFGKATLVVALDVLHLLAQLSLQHFLGRTGMHQILALGVQRLEFIETSLRQTRHITLTHRSHLSSSIPVACGPEGSEKFAIVFAVLQLTPQLEQCDGPSHN